MQAFGELGGHDAQLFVHTQLPFCGRHDEQGLQRNYTTHGASFVPQVSGGIGLAHAQGCRFASDRD